PQFVLAGQSTQMIVGATPENDYQLITVAEALYAKYSLKRVFYSAFVAVNKDKMLPDNPDGPMLLREHRLYQADWLLRFYGFSAGELLTEERPNFNVLLDPKADWAVRHLEHFPVEVNRADYQTLLRVPGIGVRSAKRIIQARRTMQLGFDELKRLGVVLKRAVYFITCKGKMMYPIKIQEESITSHLVYDDRRKLLELQQGNEFRQMSLFEDYKINMPPSIEEKKNAVFGEF
ncbi:MAG: putative DNA modification/repair radical SAM protein, partial [Lachnospiraceae bacterium]|nr:putative DNA modification/repair radical SAM protein [Lachnospiraceae bacterium]